MMNNDFMLFPAFKTKALTFSYDDGDIKDRDLVKLFNKYGLKGTFNLNSGTLGCESRVSKDEVRELYKGHEVAVHTVNHPFLEKLPLNIATKEIIDDKLALEGLSGTIVRGMAYPFGTYSDDVVQIAKYCGIAYSRTVEAHHSFKVPTDWLRMPSTCHHADKELFNLADEFVNSTPKQRSFPTEGYLFYVWGHSYEFRQDEDWQRMEEFCKLVSGKDDVWYATNIEIYDYVTAYRSLIYSSDMSKIYNPSGISVYIRRNGKNYEIKSNETITI